MPFAALKAYARELPRLRAQYALLLIQAAITPHLNEAERRAVIEQFERVANGAPELDEDAAPLRGLGFGGMSVQVEAVTRTWSEMDNANG